MKFWKMRWARYGILGLLLVAGAATVSDAYFFRFWWFRPPVPAIQDTTFDDIGANFARLRYISITQGVGITQNVSAFLQQDTTTPVTATVSGGGTVLSFDPIVLSNTTTSTDTNGDVIETQTDVVVIINDAPLRNSLFSAIYRTNGVATVTVTETVNGTPGTPQVVDPLDLSVYGSICSRGFADEYLLRGSVRGFYRDYDGTTYSYSFLSMLLNGTTPIP